MRIVLITDRPFGAREQAMLSRLEVGLTHEGVRVVHAWPGSAPTGAPASAFAQAVAYQDTGLALTLPVRAARLTDALASLEDGVAGADRSHPFDLIHACGEGCWEIAADVARSLEAALALEVWSPASVPLADRALRRARTPNLSSQSASGPTTVSRVCLCPDAALRDLVDRAIPGVATRVAPWGVHAAEEPRVPWAERQNDDAVAIAVVGSGADEHGCVAALSGLVAAARADSRLLVFVDAPIVRRRRSLWRWIRAHEALATFSLVEGLEARRDLTLRADILIQPEALGEHRSITLDAMANRVVVIARRDPGLTSLAGRPPDGGAPPALLIDQPTPKAWEEQILRVAREPRLADGQAAAGLAYVEAFATPSGHVRATLDAYEWMVGAGALPFARPARA